MKVSGPAVRLEEGEESGTPALSQAPLAPRKGVRVTELYFMEQVLPTGRTGGAGILAPGQSEAEADVRLRATKQDSSCETLRNQELCLAA